MSKAGRITIAEVEEIVDIGMLDPNEVHVPHVYVQRIIQGESYQKRIEVRKTIMGSRYTPYCT